MRISRIAALTVAILTFFGVSSLSAQTQSDLDDQACAQFHHTDAAMNDTYSRILKEYGKDERFIGKLKAAQRAWITFRDAELDAQFPKANKQVEYGTVYPMCRCNQLQRMTEERTKQLKLWLDGEPEGDVCAGSIKVAGSMYPAVLPGKDRLQEACAYSSEAPRP